MKPHTAFETHKQKVPWPLWLALPGSVLLFLAFAATASRAARAAGTGQKAVKIILKQSFPTGSFDAPPASGTVPSPGFGHPAVRYFSPKGTLLLSTDVPWLTRFEIGISGASNTAATNSACARFADANETASTTNCNFSNNGSSTPVGCGAGSGLYRVSEMDCLQNPPTDGTGGPGDGVYLRATFNRSHLSPGENILVVIEYVASAFDPAPAAPTSCFPGGTFSPEACSNVTWKLFLKHNATELVQPYMMLIPPTQNFVNTGLVTSGVSPQSRQFILPLAGDPDLSIMQLSRIHSNLNVNDPRVRIACAGLSAAAAAAGPPTVPSNSPLCAGVVIHSVSFFRM